MLKQSWSKYGLVDHYLSFVLFFNNSYHSGCEVALICICFMISNGENVFMYLLTIVYLRRNVKFFAYFVCLFIYLLQYWGLNSGPSP
jgi:hypothetical protein